MNLALEKISSTPRAQFEKSLLTSPFINLNSSSSNISVSQLQLLNSGLVDLALLSALEFAKNEYFLKAISSISLKNASKQLFLSSRKKLSDIKVVSIAPEAGYFKDVLLAFAHKNNFNWEYRESNFPDAEFSSVFDVSFYSKRKYLSRIDIGKWWEETTSEKVIGSLVVTNDENDYLDLSICNKSVDFAYHYLRDYADKSSYTNYEFLLNLDYQTDNSLNNVLEKYLSIFSEKRIRPLDSKNKSLSSFSTTKLALKAKEFQTESRKVLKERNIYFYNDLTPDSPLLSLKDSSLIAKEISEHPNSSNLVIRAGEISDINYKTLINEIEILNEKLSSLPPVISIQELNFYSIRDHISTSSLLEVLKNVGVKNLTPNNQAEKSIFEFLKILKIHSEAHSKNIKSTIFIEVNSQANYFDIFKKQLSLILSSQAEYKDSFKLRISFFNSKLSLEDKFKLLAYSKIFLSELCEVEVFLKRKQADLAKLYLEFGADAVIIES